MTASRSTLKLDLKDMTPRPSAPYVGRIGLVIISAIAIFSTVVSINSPSASTAMVVHYDRVKSEDLVASVQPLATTELAGTAPTLKNDGFNDTLVAPDLAPTGPQSHPQQARAALGRQIKFAMLAPSLQSRPAIPVVNLVEATPIVAAVIQQQPDDLVPKTESRVAVFDESPTTSEQLGGHRTSSVRSEQGGRKTSLPESPLALAIDSSNGKRVVSPDADDVQLALAYPTGSPAEKLGDVADKLFHSGDDVPVNETPAISQLPPLDTSEKPLEWQTAKVKKRDTLSQIFNRLGLSSKEAFTLAKLDSAKPLNMIRPGEKLQIARSPVEGASGKHQLESLRYPLNKFDTMVVTRRADGYEIATETREPVVELRTATAEIRRSLFGAAKRAAIPRDIVYSLAAIFGWQVDFAKNIQPGDKFSVIYEELLLDDDVVGHGEVVAAELITEDKKLQAVRHVDEDNRVTYYAPDGAGIQGSFLRSPLKFAKVTSKFSSKRLHPIHKTWKAHKGVDYGAPMRTPIRATGDGVVKKSGRKKGYGNVVVLSHGLKYETLYAHMHSFAKGIRHGSRVKQGDIIGYVGKTGWATGPHLHYEFRINGRHKNPLTVELPTSLPIDDKYRKEFVADASKWVDTLERSGRLALAENRQ